MMKTIVPNNNSDLCTVIDFTGLPPGEVELHFMPIAAFVVEAEMDEGEVASYSAVPVDIWDGWNPYSPWPVMNTRTGDWMVPGGRIGNGEDSLMEFFLERRQAKAARIVKARAARAAR